MEPNKKRRLKAWVIVVLFLVLLTIAFVMYKFFFLKNAEETLPITNIATITNKIEEYNYTLEDRDSELFNEIFKQLKANLESEIIDEDAYRESIAKLFIIDLFTIDNKMNKYDVGGLEYLLESAKESFRSKILDSIYKTVEDNSYNTRKQNLPTVQSIIVDSTEATTYQIGDEKYDAYEMIVTWNYVENLGYDTSARITMIQEENKWCIVSYEPMK